MRPKGKKAELELRRRLAVALRRRGLSIREVAEQIGCAPASVSRWDQAFRRYGPAGLDPKPQGGSRPRLSNKQRRALVRIMKRGARAAGFPTELWTLRRVKHVIEREFNVTYHIGHVWRVLHDLGFSAQKPARRAREQDEEAVRNFREREWRAIKKKRGGRKGPSS